MKRSLNPQKRARPPRAPLTQLVKVRLRAVFLQNGTHHPGLEEGGPLVHQAALPADVVLQTQAACSQTHLTAG